MALLEELNILRQAAEVLRQLRGTSAGRRVCAYLSAWIEQTEQAVADSAGDVLPLSSSSSMVASASSLAEQPSAPSAPTLLKQPRRVSYLRENGAMPLSPLHRTKPAQHPPGYFLDVVLPAAEQLLEQEGPMLAPEIIQRLREDGLKIHGERSYTPLASLLYRRGWQHTTAGWAKPD